MPKTIPLWTTVLTEDGQKYASIGNFNSKDFFLYLAYKTWSHRLQTDIICAYVIPKLDDLTIESPKSYEVGLEQVNKKDDILKRYEGTPEYLDMAHKLETRDMNTVAANLPFEQGWPLLKNSIGSVEDLVNGDIISTKYSVRLSNSRIISCSLEEFETMSCKHRSWTDYLVRIVFQSNS